MIPLLSHKHSILLPLHHVLADLFRFARCPSVSCGGIDFREASSRTTLPSYQETSRGNSSHFLLLRRPAYHHFSWLLPCPRFCCYPFVFRLASSYFVSLFCRSHTHELFLLLCRVFSPNFLPFLLLPQSPPSPLPRTPSPFPAPSFAVPETLPPSVSLLEAWEVRERLRRSSQMPKAKHLAPHSLQPGRKRARSCASPPPLSAFLASMWCLGRVLLSN